MKRIEHPLFEGVPHWIVKGGVSVIFVAAQIAACFGGLWLFNYTAPVSVPLLLSVVVGIIAFPLAKMGDRFKIPRKVSASIVVLLVFITLWGAVQITVAGVVSEAGNIGNELVKSVNTLGRQLDDASTSLGITQEQVNEITSSINRSIQNMFEPGPSTPSTGGVFQTVATGLGSLKSAVTGIVSVLFGIIIAAMILYYLLSDYEMIEQWAGTHLGVEPELGIGIIEDATSSLREYFKGITIKGIVTALGTGITLILFGVPLVIPIVIVTFITGYVPFVGAWLAVAFAVLVTFGTKGMSTALIVLLVCVILQNVLEQIVYNRVVGDRLNMHPIAVLVTTMAGLTLAGLLGATLATPLAAMVVRIHTRLKVYREHGGQCTTVACLDDHAAEADSI